VQEPFVPVHPALQLHAAIDMPATGRWEFAGQRTHTILLSSEYEPAAQSVHVSVDALTTSEYFPGAQSVHATDPLLGLNFPATHPVQEPFVPVQPALQLHAVIDTPATGRWEFAGQRTHTVLAFSEYEPAAQSLHVSVDALTTSEYFPGAQSVHATDPLLGLNFPGTQAVQEPFVPVQPALQLHAVIDTPATGRLEFAGQRTHTVLAFSEYVPAAQPLHVSVDALTTSEYFPGAQSVHATDPLLGLNFPATQAVQAPFVPVQPALQLHAVRDTPAKGMLEFTGQRIHTVLAFSEYKPAAQSLHVSVDALTTSEYFPGAQNVHATDPLSGLNFPATHPVQTPPFSPVYPALHLHAVCAMLPAGEVESELQAAQEAPNPAV